MNWRSPVLGEASRRGDYGKVIELVRKEARLTQQQLGEACGLSQSAVSRLEKRGTGSYSTDTLASAAAHLGIPARLVGLAERSAVRNGMEQVERRGFLGGVAAVAAGPILGAVPHVEASENQAAALRLNTATYRRLDSSTPARDLAEAVHAHIRLIQNVARDAGGDGQRLRLAAVGSEAAGLAAWLAWDTGDNGAARSWYGSALRAARSANDPLLAAYQAGSLAQFEAHAGNGTQALNLTRSARRYLGERRPAVADAWLCSVEGLAHAANGDQRAADHALTRSRTLAEKTAPEEPPPWPWVFPFDANKVAACRITCGARLGLADWVFGGDTEALASGHAKQRALVVLDLAAGHLAAGRIEAAFALASGALDTGLRYRSGRIVERSCAVRRSLMLASPPKVVRDFDERLHGVHL